MPLPPQSLSDILWLPGKFMWVFGKFQLGLGRTDGGLGYRWSPVFALAMAWGFWVLWRKQRDAALFLFLPILLVVGLSAVEIYPFTARLIVFLIPGMLIAVAAGASHVLTNWPERLQVTTPVALAVLGGAPVYAAATALPPSFIQHMKPVLEHVSRDRQPGDKTYVFYGAAHSFRYYAPRFGLSGAGVLLGRCARDEPREYLRQLDEARGEKRLWLIFTHVNRPGELEVMLGYLDRIGRRLDAVVVPGSTGQLNESASTYLYDLSDPSRLATTSAAEFEPAPPRATGPGRVWGCHGVVDQPRY